MKMREDLVHKIQQHMKTIIRALKFYCYINLRYTNVGLLNIKETGLKL